MVFENEKGEKDLVSTEALTDLFALFDNRVDCVVLNACYSEVQAEAIREHIKYVIGMKKEITDRAAIAFSIGFYRALGFGRSFEDAFEFGRNAIQLAIGDSSKSRDAITEIIKRKLVPVGEVPETVITQEHLKPVLYKKKSPPIHNPDPIEGHFQYLLRAIKRGKIVPFLGSGINLCDRKDDIKPINWKSDGQYPPTRSELAVYLEKEILGTTLTDVQCPLCDLIGKPLPKDCPIIERNISFTRLLFQHVSQLGELQTGGMGDLKEALDKIYMHSYKPNILHEFFAKLHRTLRQKGYETPILIVTANFDSTLELAFKKEKQPFDLLSYVVSRKCFLHQKFRKDDRDGAKIVSKDEKLITDPNNYMEIDFDAYPVVLKLYGPVDWSNNNEENFTITEDHFIDYLAQRPIGQMLPASILEKLHQKHIWFLGYGLSNWDERVPLRRIWSNEKKRIRKWWAIQMNPKALDESLWESNNVKLIKMSLDNYITKLDQLLKKL